MSGRFLFLEDGEQTLREKYDMGWHMIWNMTSGDKRLVLTCYMTYIHIMSEIN